MLSNYLSVIDQFSAWQWSSTRGRLPLDTAVVNVYYESCYWDNLEIFKIPRGILKYIGLFYPPDL